MFLKNTKVKATTTFEKSVAVTPLPPPYGWILSSFWILNGM